MKFLANGPREEIAWTLGQGWNLFLDGHCATKPDLGDLPTLAQDPKTSKVQGKIGAAPLPGTTKAFNPITGEWKKYDLNQVGNTNGGTALRDLASVEETGGDLRFSGVHGEQEERAVQLHDRLDRRSARHEVRYPRRSARKNQRLDGRQPSLEPGRRRRVSQGLLRRCPRRFSRNICDTRHGRVLARSRRRRLAVLGGQMQPKAALDATAAS